MTDRSIRTTDMRCKPVRAIAFIPEAWMQTWWDIGDHFRKSGRTPGDAFVCTFLARALMVTLTAFLLWLLATPFLPEWMGGM